MGTGFFSRSARSGLKARFRRCAHDSSGATAVEFALLAPLFFALVFAIIESCLAFGAQQILSNATDDVARKIRTGQLKNLDKPQLKAEICKQLKIIVTDCPGSLRVDLQNASFEEAAGLRMPLNVVNVVEGTYALAPEGDFVVEHGTSGERQFLRTFYEWPIFTDIIRKRLTYMDNGKGLLFATATWRNEPYDD